MDALVAFLAAVAAGYVLRAMRPRRTKPVERPSMLALRTATPRAGEAYRDAAAETSCTLEELRGDLIAAGLPAVIEGSVIELTRGKEHVRITALDPRHVTLPSLDISQTGCDALYFEMALALVPRFGSLRLAVALWGVYVVDGARDAAALVEERSGRIRAMASAIARDMEEKERVWSKVQV